MATISTVPADEMATIPSVLTSEVKKQVRDFWEASPCDSWFTDCQLGTSEFYKSLDEHRYKVHQRLLPALEVEKTRGLRVLEIGCGCGSEAERFARAGARYTGIDLTDMAIRLSRKRFQLARLKGTFLQGDAEDLPFPDDSFEVVYSHGVLHHTPDTAASIREVYRVLVPGGRTVVMLYHKDSFNYKINLKVIRRIRAHMLRTAYGIKLVRAIWRESERQVHRHSELIRKDPITYFEDQNFLNRNTDGADNPLSQVFSRASAGELFWQFNDIGTEVMFWNPRWLPGIGMLIPNWLEDFFAARWGWHLWIYAQKACHRSNWLDDQTGISPLPICTEDESQSREYSSMASA